MVAGHADRIKIGAIIQARIRSSRLPAKVLLPLPFPDGQPILKHIITSIRDIPMISSITIATSSNTENDVIEEFAEKENIGCYRGSEDDVLSRFIAISNAEQLSHIIRLTGDNPLIASKELKETLQFHLEGSFEYTQSEGLPLGMNFEIINAETLSALQNQQLSYDHKEHVTKYIIEKDIFNRGVLKFDHPSFLKSLRCTVDYPSDYAMLNIIMTLLGDQINSELIAKICSIYNDSSWIFDINSENLQK